uniref:Uncharacterized protein n=1 Tax=Oryza sativa subsp. japonica TaxID=39947 RepID=Q6ZH54_ORYSJ|nr:hypothetical protein [Oryza sativa Japonica Group]
MVRRRRTSTSQTSRVRRLPIRQVEPPVDMMRTSPANVFMIDILDGLLVGHDVRRETEQSSATSAAASAGSGYNEAVAVGDRRQVGRRPACGHLAAGRGGLPAASSMVNQGRIERDFVPSNPVRAQAKSAA